MWEGIDAPSSTGGRERRATACFFGTPFSVIRRRERRGRARRRPLLRRAGRSAREVRVRLERDVQFEDLLSHRRIQIQHPRAEVLEEHEHRPVEIRGVVVQCIDDPDLRMLGLCVGGELLRGQCGCGPSLDRKIGGLEDVALDELQDVDEITFGDNAAMVVVAALEEKRRGSVGMARCAPHSAISGIRSVACRGSSRSADVVGAARQSLRGYATSRRSTTGAPAGRSGATAATPRSAVPYRVQGRLPPRRRGEAHPHRRWLGDGRAADGGTRRGSWRTCGRRAGSSRRGRGMLVETLGIAARDGGFILVGDDPG